jgi:uncharacterized protein (TIGR02466 family)
MIEIMNLFPSAIGVKDTRIDTSKMLETCLQIESEEHGLVHGEAKSTYSTEVNILEHSNFSMLKSVITSEAKIFGRQIGIDMSNVKLGRSWFNIQKRGSTIMQHNHRRSVISGAFYIYADRDAAPITFANPLTAHKMHEPSIGGSTDYDVEFFKVPAETGKLVLFPSWLEHYVGYNNSDMRVTLSFNFS